MSSARGRHKEKATGACRTGQDFPEEKRGSRPQDNLFTRGKEGRPRRTSKLAGSISRGIALDEWMRKLGEYVLLDMLIVCAMVAGFVLQCNQALPDDFFRGTAHLVYAPGVQVWLDGLSSNDWTALIYVVSGPMSRSYSFPVSESLAWAVAIASAVVVFQVLSLINGIFLPRHIRRRLKPLNDLALTAEAMGSATADNPMGSAAGTAADKMETLKHAIDSANVNAPNVSTGDADLRSIEVALNGLLRQMQEAKLQQMQFVNDASHELRTPIAVIQGYVNMLDRWGKTDPEVLDESIAALKQESTHMQELVEQLLFLARGDAGRNNLHMETIDLGTIVREVYEESAMIDPSHTYCLSVQGKVADMHAMGETAAAPTRELSMPTCLMVGDVALVKQAMRILVQNAVKYSPAGTQITIGLQADGRKVACSVADEGIGLAPEEVPHAFERFWRADEARQAAGVGGTGLGLSIAKWIMDAHEGRIDVVSLKGVGTRFTLEFSAA